jgi:pimeloyl-ACP methyl ester carboxylesterase
MAPLWDELMQGLGYSRYGAGGTDFGAGVTTFMALDRPEPLSGIHLTFLDEPPFTGPGSRPLADVKRELYAVRRWTEMPREGHFPALEEPKLLARDIGALFRDLP